MLRPSASMTIGKAEAWCVSAPDMPSVMPVSPLQVPPGVMR
jgi:hypothetical protein